MIRVLLADDQALVRGALAAMLGLEADIEVVAQVGSGAEVVAAMEEARKSHPGNHLLLAVLLAKIGALDETGAELDKLNATDPLTAEAPRKNLMKIRGK